MLCTEQRFACLLQCSLDNGTEYCVLIGSVLCWNQLLERTTGLCQYQALQESCFVDSSVSAFPLKLRCATTEQDGEKYLAERPLSLLGAQDRSGRVLTNVTGFLDQELSGMVNVLSVSACMAAFRTSLCQVVADRLVTTW